MEVVLSVDNLLFLSLIGAKLPEASQKRLWRLWLLWSPALRIALLAGTVTILRQEQVLWRSDQWDLTLRGAILALGGAFLMYKAVREIFHQTEKREREVHSEQVFSRVLLQAVLVDIVFSLDSVLTAVGLARVFWVAAGGVLLSIAVMVWAARWVQAFIQRHPSFQILGLAFLLLIGFMLFVEGVHIEVPRGYIYFAMFFSFGVEVLQMRLRRGEEEPVREK